MMITTLDFSDKEDFIDNISDTELMPDLHKQGGINLLLSKWVPVRGSQMVQLHPSIFEEDLNCTYILKNSLNLWIHTVVEILVNTPST